MRLDVLFSAARHPWSELRDLVCEAETEGYGTAWVYDHLSGEVLGGSTMLECFTLAGALASATTSMRIGTLVANAANRSPGLTVTAAASVQTISGGRFVFGLGAGAAPGTRWASEHEVLGHSLPATMLERHRRVIDVLDWCDLMWDPQREARYAGFPLPSPRPPVVLGVNSVTLGELAASRCDGLNVFAGHPRLDDIVTAARTARARSASRRDQPFTVSVWTPRTPEAADPDGVFQVSLRKRGVDS